MQIKHFYRYIENPLYKNASYLMTNTISMTGLGFVFWMIIARFYLASDVGLAATIISSMNLIMTLATLGFRVALVRFLPLTNEKKSNDTINSCFSISGTFCIVLSIIFLLGLSVWSPKLFFIRDNILYAFFFILFTLVWVITTLLNSVFNAQQIAKYTFIKNLIFSILKIPIAFLVVSFGAFGVFYSWGFAALIAFLISTVFHLPRILPKYKPKFLVKRDIINDMLHFSFGNYIAGFLSAAPGIILPLMITNTLFPEMTAYFYIAWMIAGLLFMIPTATSISLLAEGSRNKEKLDEKAIKSIKFTLIFLIPGVIFIFIFGDKLLLLFSDEYAENATSLLQLLAISSIPFAFNTIYLTVKNIKKQVKILVVIRGLTAFVTLGSSYLLMSKIGLIGIGIGWIASQMVVMGIFMFYVLKSGGTRNE